MNYKAVLITASTLLAPDLAAPSAAAQGKAHIIEEISTAFRPPAARVAQATLKRGGPAITSDVLRVPKFTKDAVSKEYSASVVNWMRPTSHKEPAAEFVLSSGKIKVNKAFRLGPLEVKVGEFDLRKWAAAASLFYVACANGRSPERRSEQEEKRCIKGSYYAAAKAFGRKDLADNF